MSIRHSLIISEEKKLLSVYSNLSRLQFQIRTLSILSKWRHSIENSIHSFKPIAKMISNLFCFFNKIWLIAASMISMLITLLMTELMMKLVLVTLTIKRAISIWKISPMERERTGLSTRQNSFRFLVIYRQRFKLTSSNLLMTKLPLPLLWLTIRTMPWEISRNTTRISLRLNSPLLI